MQNCQVVSDLQNCQVSCDLNLPTESKVSHDIKQAICVTTTSNPRLQGTNLADNSPGGVECTAHHPGSRGVADIVSVTMPLMSIKDFAVAV